MLLLKLYVPWNVVTNFLLVILVANKHDQAGALLLACTIDIFKKYKLDVFNLGTTNKTNRIKINNSINKSINVLKTAWENGLREKL